MAYPPGQRRGVNEKGRETLRFWCGCPASPVSRSTPTMPCPRPPRSVIPISQTDFAMNKARLIKQIVASLTESLGVLEKAARASNAEATHESSKAKSKYDT